MPIPRTPMTSGFVNGSYATTILYLHYASQFVRAEGAAFNGDIGFAPLPGNNSLLAGGSLGVGRFSEHAAKACRFIQWATGPDIAPALVMLGYLPLPLSMSSRISLIHIHGLSTWPNTSRTA